MNDQPTPSVVISEKVCELIAEKLCLEIKQVTPEKDIQTDLRADSLDMVETIMEIETYFKIAIPDQTMEDFRTVGDVIAHVEGRIGSKEFTPKSE